ncbi:MAG: hypothetical protein JZD41_01280, partial [Thermoproteus sp.]|nr:hypothetical protein [Thermoproteus sp.]
RTLGDLLRAIPLVKAEGAERAAVAVDGVHAESPVIAFGMVSAGKANARQASEGLKNISLAYIKAEVWRRASKEGWRHFMVVEKVKLTVKCPNLSEPFNNAKIGEIVEKKIEGDPHVDAKWT